MLAQNSLFPKAIVEGSIRAWTCSLRAASCVSLGGESCSAGSRVSAFDSRRLVLAKTPASFRRGPFENVTIMAGPVSRPARARLRMIIVPALTPALAIDCPY